MTLYFWMHWFWITSWLYFIHGDLTSTLIPLSAEEVPRKTNSSERKSKSIGVISLIPPSNFGPSNTSFSSSNISTSRFSKPSIKKLDLIFSNNSMKSDSTKAYPKKDMSVINQTVSDISGNTTDNQMLLNSNFTTMNHTENLTYFGEDVYNQSLISSSERVELEDEVTGNLTVASITGITLGCVLFIGLIFGGSYILYRNRGFNRPQVLNDRCSNPDSSGYIDDASVRDNSEEMYSLDNDSFLNSLEAMTIQNYWTDTVKHTKL